MRLPGGDNGCTCDRCGKMLEPYTELKVRVSYLDRNKKKGSTGWPKQIRKFDICKECLEELEPFFKLVQ